jgi:hypothetical protein
MAQQSGNTKAPMGKPSGIPKGGNGLKEVNIDQKTNEEISDRYLDENEEVNDPSKVAHVNRNVSKNEEQ